LIAITLSALTSGRNTASTSGDGSKPLSGALID
jgi:hypothetical protein